MSDDERPDRPQTLIELIYELAGGQVVGSWHRVLQLTFMICTPLIVLASCIGLILGSSGTETVWWLLGLGYGGTTLSIAALLRLRRRVLRALNNTVDDPVVRLTSEPSAGDEPGDDTQDQATEQRRPPPVVLPSIEEDGNRDGDETGDTAVREESNPS